MSGIQEIVQDLTQEDIFFNLRIRGYPLYGSEDISGKKISVEELIIYLIRINKDARVIEGIPVIIQKNIIDFQKLYVLALENGVVNAVGWILDETLQAFKRNNIIEKNNLLHRCLEIFYKSRSSLEYVLSTSKIPEYINHSRKTRPETAQKWNLVLRYDPSSFDRKLSAYRNVPVNQ